MRALFSFAFLLGFCSTAQAVSNVMFLKTSGIQYCGDYQVQKFTPATDVDQWIRTVDDKTVQVSYTPDFREGYTQTFIGYSYAVGANKRAFFYSSHGDTGMTSSVFVLTYNKYGAIKSGVGDYTNFGLHPQTGDVCFSSGKVSAVPWR